MQVGISLLTLVPRVSGGSETYARELVRALGRVGEHSYRVLLPTIASDLEGLPSEVVNEYRAATSMPGRTVAMTEGVVRGRRLRRRLSGLDVVHFPLTVMIPRVATPAPVTTVLDLQHEFLPQFFSRAELAYRRAVYGWSIRKSRLVVTISQHAARAVVERYDVPESRVRPIHLGLDHAVFRPGDEPARTVPRLSGTGVAAQEPRSACSRRSPSSGGAIPISSWCSRRTRARRLPASGRSAMSRATSSRACTGAAAGLVFPSLFEGFGQPPLEAMACGCPVASSNAAALPEVCGDGARLFDPTSVEAMVDGGRGHPREPGRVARPGARSSGALLVGTDSACPRRRLRCRSVTELS